MNPYEAPTGVQEESDLPQSRLQAARRGALKGMIFGTKWAILLLGPILASGWLIIVVLVIYRHTQGPLRPVPFTSIAIAVLTILLAAIGLLLTAIIGVALAGASIMGLAALLTYRPGSARQNSRPDSLDKSDISSLC